MNTGKIYTIQDFLLNIIKYGRTIGFLVSFPNLYIPDEERISLFKQRREGLQFLKEAYDDIKFYIDNDIFTAGQIIDDVYESAKYVLPTLEDVNWSNTEDTEEEIKEHIELLKQTSYIIISMIITNIMTDDVYPEKNVMRFIEID